MFIIINIDEFIKRFLGIERNSMDLLRLSLKVFSYSKELKILRSPGAGSFSS
jgi:hypothetical protein